MAIFMVCISAQGRNRLGTVVLALSLLSTAFSSLYLASVLYSWFRHAYLLHDLIISLFDRIYYNLLLLAVLLLTVALVSLKLNRNLRLQPFNHSMRRAHQMWVFSLCISCVTMGLTATLMSQALTRVEAQLEPRYKHGLSRYMESPDWEAAIDRIQENLQCCGGHSHTDWYTATWIPLRLLPPDPTLYSKVAQPNGRVLVPLVPSSCCRKGSRDCGHRAFLEAKGRSWIDIQPADPKLLYTTGCTQTIANAITRDLYIFKGLLLIILLLQLGMLVSSRFLFSSTINSVLLGNPLGKVPGWLMASSYFGLGKFKGPNLEDYDKICGGEEVLPEDGTKRGKRKWDCMSRIRGKSKKETDSNETLSTKAKNMFSKSPCLAKLKQKYKKKTKSKTQAPESETEIIQTPEIVVETVGGSNERSRSEDIVRGSSLSEGSTSVKKKLSGNLVGEEDEFSPKPINTQKTVYEFRTKQTNPFMKKDNVKAAQSPKHVLFIKSPSPRPNENISQNKVQSVLKYGGKEYGFLVQEQDFKSTRDVFESASKSQNTANNNAKTSTLKYTGKRYPANLIELDDPEPAVKEDTIKQFSQASSAESEEDAPVFFRNYMLSK